MAWATLDESVGITGSNLVDEPSLAAAQSSIELHAGRIPGDTLSERDLHWLKYAVAYQAAWIAAQPDYLERRNASSESADDQSVAHWNPDSVSLAPLARKALRRLSFRGPRTIAPYALPKTLGDDAEEGRLPWQPMNV